MYTYIHTYIFMYVFIFGLLCLNAELRTSKKRKVLVTTSDQCDLRIAYRECFPTAMDSTC